MDRLKRALSSAGWYLTRDGHAQPFGRVDPDTGGRAALDEQVARLRRSTGDPALLIGTAKELLETVSKFVLEEVGYPGSDKMEYNQLWHLARERLGDEQVRVGGELCDVRVGSCVSGVGDDKAVSGEPDPSVGHEVRQRPAAQLERAEAVGPVWEGVPVENLEYRAFVILFEAL
ncbi:hypothetical protein LP422_20865 [Janibacter limosus]|uniref:Uncharacterized protein n=1 Tax=Janibacter limosus TaxID=53458 RepID=A0AC61U4B1_9MICO|nr:hypothetical protein [Janibacter limosus]UUZ44721.1 hypothetical protein LP422_20865 [Janibacter limosus]